MIIESIQIQGMHNVASKTYTFNDGLTYFVGKNGAGKSTILEAVQLAILGYIPGLPKTAESIYSHANGPVMSVTATLRNDDGSAFDITRAWMRSGQSVKTSYNMAPCVMSPDAFKQLIGEAELPIFNFAEFNSLTANKMKDWFINLLPNSSTEIKWEEVMLKAATDASLATDEDAFNEIYGEVNNHPSFVEGEGVDQIRNVNEYLKSVQSFVKGRIASTQSTISSLVHYDDVDTVADASEIKKEIAQLEVWKSEEIAHKTAVNHAESVTKVNADRIVAMKNAIAQVQKQLDAIPEDDVEAMNTIAVQLAEKEKEVEAQKAVVESLKPAAFQSSADTCPILNIECDKLKEKKKVVDKAKAELEKAKKELEGIQNELAELLSHRHELEINQNLRSKYQKDIETYSKSLEALYATNDVMIPESTSPYPVEEIDQKLSNLREILIKLEANAKYESLIDALTKDKFKLELEQELLKVWIKLTDVNGLQTEYMDKSFNEFEDKLTAYVAKMLPGDVKAKFNLSSKANSFSFGLMRDNAYIKYDLLSSGEKCMYLTAFMLCITEMLGSELKLVLIDDLIDHLDEEAVSRFFEVASNCGVQFITAGVNASKTEADVLID